jgi:type II secretion system protein H
MAIPVKKNTFYFTLDFHRFAAGKPKQCGFSLFELLVVLVIISLMSAMVLPKLTGRLSSLTLKTSAKNVAAALRHARNSAATEKIPFISDFYLKESRLHIFSVARPETDPEITEAKIQKDAKSVDYDYELPAGIRFLDNDPDPKQAGNVKLSVFFFPNGSSSGGEIAVVNEDGRMYLLRIDLITGCVSIAEAKKGDA